MADLSTITLPNGNEYNLKDANAIPSSEKAAANGVATLDANGLVPQSQMPGMVILSYGNNTWADFLAAYQKNNIIYCRASSNSNPASGSQTRLAFMAYVNNATTPTEVEFQYYRSVSSHSATQQGDQVYVYKLTNKNAWTVTVRETYTKVVTNNGLTSTWASGTLTAKANLVSDTKLTNAATADTEVADRVYPVALDTNGKLAVNVPWESGSTLQWTIDNDGSGSTSLQATIQNDVTNNVASGMYAHAEGSLTTASGNLSHAEGDSTIASANMSHAEGSETQASGQYSHAEGYGTTASGAGSHTEGNTTQASRTNAHAEGGNTIASGICAHVEGEYTVASGEAAHAEGCGKNNSGTIDTTYGASGNYSHVEGHETKAQGIASHAEGYRTIASGHYTHTEGENTTASGESSHAEGMYTTANHRSQHVFGELNVLDTSSALATARGTYIEIVGNGDSNNARSNARTLDWSGNEVLAGKLTVGAAPTNNMDVATKQYVDNKSITITASITQPSSGSTGDLWIVLEEET